MQVEVDEDQMVRMFKLNRTPHDDYENDAKDSDEDVMDGDSEQHSPEEMLDMFLWRYMAKVNNRY